MSNWKLVYSGIFQDGAKIKTERDGENILLAFKRKFDAPELSFVLTTQQAIEVSYALLRAIKHINEEEE